MLDTMSGFVTVLLVVLGLGTVVMIYMLCKLTNPLVPSPRPAIAGAKR